VNTPAREAVLLLHGLWMNRFVLLYFARVLERAGFAVQALGYRSMRAPLEENVEHLARRVAATGAARVHLVGHSLGGVVALRYLQRGADARVQRAVLLGSPLSGCHAALALARIPGGRFLLGQSAPVWRAALDTSLDSRFEVGVIAGTRPLGLARLITRLPAPNDGVVCVDETRLPGARDQLELHVSHMGMIFDARTALATAAFLARGAFPR